MTLGAVIGGLTSLALFFLIVFIVRKIKRQVKLQEIIKKRSEYQREIVASRSRELSSSGDYDNENSSLPRNIRTTFDARTNNFKIYNDTDGTYYSVDDQYLDMSKQPEYEEMIMADRPLKVERDENKVSEQGANSSRKNQWTFQSMKPRIRTTDMSNNSLRQSAPH